MGPNVGEMTAAVMAAAGMNICGFACRVACETDYLAISGATFPATVSRAEMEAFNKRTMKPVMDEKAEFERYCKIATFFHGGSHVRR